MDNETTSLVVSERKRIGTMLSVYRKSKELTQEQLADKLGVTKSSINKMENGVWISLEMVIKLSKILDFRITLSPLT